MMIHDFILLRKARLTNIAGVLEDESQRKGHRSKTCSDTVRSSWIDFRQGSVSFAAIYLPRQKNSYGVKNASSERVQVQNMSSLQALYHTGFCFSGSNQETKISAHSGHLSKLWKKDANADRRKEGELIW
jgi:hypothetical protein